MKTKKQLAFKKRMKRAFVELKEVLDNKKAKKTLEDFLNEL